MTPGTALIGPRDASSVTTETFAIPCWVPAMVVRSRTSFWACHSRGGPRRGLACAGRLPAVGWTPLRGEAVSLSLPNSDLLALTSTHWSCLLRRCDRGARWILYTWSDRPGPVL